MNVEDVSRNLNKRVRYKNPRTFIDAEYIFAAYTIRLVKGNIYRQAELMDIHNNGSIIVVKLEEVEEID